MEFITDISQVVLFIGVLAFAVSAITEVVKKLPWLDKKVPSALVAIIASVILCPAAMLGLISYYGTVIEWYMIFASFIAAFVVALVSMDGWERVNELAGRFIKK